MTKIIAKAIRIADKAVLIGIEMAKKARLTSKSHRMTLPVHGHLDDFVAPTIHKAAPTWPSFTGKSVFVGTSPSGNASIWVDPRLGPLGLSNAQSLLAAADSIAIANDEIFGTSGGPVNVLVCALGGMTNGQGGADHMGCDYKTGKDIEVDACLHTPVRVRALFEAELSECSMNGNLCGLSTGEALSRWCALWIVGDVLQDFATVPGWAINDAMPNWINKTEQTDGGASSTGCGMAFISWLIHKGHGLDIIAPAMVKLGDKGTFADLYAVLTGRLKIDAWPDFQAAVADMGGIHIKSFDDPFRALLLSGRKD